MILRANRILFVKNKENVAFNQPLVHETKSSQEINNSSLIAYAQQCSNSLKMLIQSAVISASFYDH